MRFIILLVLLTIYFSAATAQFAPPPRGPFKKSPKKFFQECQILLTSLKVCVANLRVRISALYALVIPVVQRPSIRNTVIRALRLLETDEKTLCTRARDL